MSVESKRLKMSNSTLSIGTHNGTFHCDEVLACFMLKQLAQYEGAPIVRTRDEAQLSQCDIVVDVGGVYDAATKRFDHHQRSFNLTMKDIRPEKRFSMKLSSAGLVYVHYGEQVLSEITKHPVDSLLVQTLYDKVYEQFIQEVDAIDNGIAPYDGDPRYAITTNLSHRVSYLNPPWTQPVENTDELFHKAMQVVGGEFVDRVSYYANVWWKARSHVKEAVTARHEVDASGAIVRLPMGGIPWKEHLFSVETEVGLHAAILYVLYSDTNGTWRVQCVPIWPDSFESRLALPEPWRGLRNEQLDEITGTPGGVFVHASGFIGGHRDYDGALAMARKSIELQRV